MNVKTLWRYLACALFGAVIAVLVMKLTDTTDHPPLRLMRVRMKNTKSTKIKS
jgi:hypothetical protein